MGTSKVVRFGVLGAARITPAALLAPAAASDDVEVVVVGARDEQRAKGWAAEHGIERVARGYADVIDDPDIDAVYNALPASHHRQWTIAALEAGKHVLCEKPFALNAAEAAEMVDAGQRSGRVLCEAFHWRFHPLADRIIALLPEVGTVKEIGAVFTAAIPDTTDIRYDLALGGGALMDLGCYPVHWIRTVMGEEPVVESAQARQGPPAVDVELTGQLRFPGGARASVRCSMDGDFAARLDIEGERGALRVINPLAPHFGHALSLEIGGGEPTNETVPGATTYKHQLDAFVAAVRSGQPTVTGGRDAVGNMQVIDDLYTAAGLPIRGA